MTEFMIAFIGFIAGMSFMALVIALIPPKYVISAYLGVKGK